MKKRLIIPLAAALLTSSANATLIADHYIGAGSGGADLYRPAGAESDPRYDAFEIIGADVTHAGGGLSVKVYTNFAGKAGTLGFTAPAERTNPHIKQSGYPGLGIGYGDLLFTGSGLHSYGTGPGYDQDGWVYGTEWVYGFVLDEPFSNTGGEGAVYRIGGWGPAPGPNEFYKYPNTSYVLPSDALLDGSVVRPGASVAANHEYLDEYEAPLLYGTWGVGEDYLEFDMPDFDSLGLDANNLGLHWTMYSANDVFEGTTGPRPIPAPGVASLMLLGLGGLWVARRKRRGAAQSGA